MDPLDGDLELPDFIGGLGDFGGSGGGFGDSDGLSLGSGAGLGAGLDGGLGWEEQRLPAIPEPLLGLEEGDLGSSSEQQQRRRQHAGDDAAGEQQAEHASRQLQALHLGAAGAGAPDADAAGVGEAAPLPLGPDPAAVEADPLAALQAAIEADRRCFKPSPGWEKMLEAVEEEMGQAGPALLPAGAGGVEVAVAADDAAVDSPLAGSAARQQQGQGQEQQAETEPMEQSVAVAAVTAGSQQTTEVLSSSGGGGSEGEVASNRMQV